jgi:hypothetical protein
MAGEFQDLVGGESGEVDTGEGAPAVLAKLGGAMPAKVMKEVGTGAEGDEVERGRGGDRIETRDGCGLPEGVLTVPEKAYPEGVVTVDGLPGGAAYRGEQEEVVEAVVGQAGGDAMPDALREGGRGPHARWEDKEMRFFFIRARGRAEGQR